jgi:hypothetical protein
VLDALEALDLFVELLDLLLKPPALGLANGGFFAVGAVELAEVADVPGPSRIASCPPR